jgi:hypothetical protein
MPQQLRELLEMDMAIRRLTSVFLPVMLACSEPQVPNQVDVLVGEGLRLAAGQIAPTGPVFLDTASLGVMHRVLDGAAFDAKAEAARLRRPLRAAGWSEAIRCPTPNVSCTVLDNGLFVRVDSSRTADSTATILVTYAFTTHTGPTVYGVCDIPTELTFARAGDRWQHIDTRPRLRC